MKRLQNAVSLLLISCSTTAFAPVQFAPRNSALFTATPLMDLPSTDAAKKDLIATAEKLKEEYGLLLIDASAKKALSAAVEELEAKSEPPSSVDDLLGGWELVCSTSVSNEGIDTSKLPFFDAGPLKQIRDSIRKTANKYLKVEQVIKAEDGMDIDRVDHVLEYEPPTELSQVLDSLPEQLTSLNINPLQVDKSKLILIHKANVESETPLKVHLSLKSIVLNVAGQSTFLDPNGADVTGINLPLGEFLNAGSFETTFMDDELRISRGKQGFSNVLRVFVRKGQLEKDAALRDIENSDVSVGMGVDAELDVDDVIDPEFINDDSPSDVESSP